MLRQIPHDFLTPPACLFCVSVATSEDGMGLAADARERSRQRQRQRLGQRGEKELSGKRLGSAERSLKGHHALCSACSQESLRVFSLPWSSFAWLAPTEVLALHHIWKELGACFLRIFSFGAHSGPRQ